MVKKIAKYSKFILCIALILSLVAPSYAALSASDGSAFVTKAEFDSALADFNARLTTFEAGINSKIDSQVTSYLDRNGIWNGKSQNVNFNFLNAGWQMWGKGGSPSANLYWIKNNSMSSINFAYSSGGGSGDNRFRIFIDGWSTSASPTFDDRSTKCTSVTSMPSTSPTDYLELNLIENVSKSGLLRLEYFDAGGNWISFPSLYYANDTYLDSAAYKRLFNDYYWNTERTFNGSDYVAYSSGMENHAAGPLPNMAAVAGFNCFYCQNVLQPLIDQSIVFDGFQQVIGLFRQSWYYAWTPQVKYVNLCFVDKDKPLKLVIKANYQDWFFGFKDNTTPWGGCHRYSDIKAVVY